MGTATTSSPAAPLDYGHAPPRWRRHIRRSLVLLALAAAILCAGYCGHALWDNGERLHWQNQCLSYTASPEQVVYEEEPTAAQRLLDADRQYTRQPDTRPRQGSGQPPMPAIFSPRCWESFRTSLPPSAGLWISSPPGAVVFLHELRSPGGKRYLAKVTYARLMDAPPTYWMQEKDYQADTFVPGTLFRPPVASPIMHMWGGSTSIMFDPPPNLRIYAGQVDPADPSHFTIRYEMWGQSDIADGRVDNSGHINIQPQRVPRGPVTMSNLRILAATTQFTTRPSTGNKP